ncbi:double-stranded RNA-specific adenosine deaminase-like isoform X2 [Mya arenaria]|uniref:double-stranded RNA-specific adenosine deaminase-like isoform X2 n=1 Tax=Mya arenaria TaxID=6604 RepID=UPI0022E465AC|nr:double-stranded RNA-specific adenosine deaminase-like isoform X2 [Mya arenaria]
MSGRQNLNKNAISAFEEHGVRTRKPPKVDILDSSGPPHRPVYTAVATLGGEEVGRETGNSKHEARIKAAERALQNLSIQDTGASNGQEEEDTCVSEEDLTNPVPDRDPVSALMEFSQTSRKQVHFNLISQEGPPHMPVFTMSVTLGDETFPQVKGCNSKNTKKDAACVALNALARRKVLQTKFPRIGGQVNGAASNARSRPDVTLGIPGKNPVSMLNEFAQKISKKLTFDAVMFGPPHKPRFRVTAVLEDERFVEVESPSKKQGNVLAAQEAIRVLQERGEYSLPKAILGQSQPNIQILTPPHQLPLHDRVGQVAMTKMEELLSQTPQSLVGRKVMAAIVMTDNKTSISRVVSLGTGNRIIKGDKITQDGTVLHDSHAEILARRGFKRFLYSLVKSDPHCYLTPGLSGKFRFKPFISFHLFISTAPCGDGALFVHCDGENGNGDGMEHKPLFNNPRTQGLMRAKQENGEGTIPISEDDSKQTIDGILHGNRLRIMSCSDKICLWNVVGLQGALLSRVFEPIYLKSITLGSLFHLGHLSRALCCRVNINAIDLQLPHGYHINHPDIGVTTTPEPARAVEKSRPLSMNWAFGDANPEITDATLGKTYKSLNMVDGPSRLCKRSIFELDRQTLGHPQNSTTYRLMKQNADSYNQAKMAFQTRMNEQKYGTWVKMPVELNRFTCS